MNYDPNWFYSSLAQCAAAIIGILGAILATRLQDQHSHIFTNYKEVMRNLQSYKSQMINSANNIKFYVKFVDRRLQELKNAISEEQSHISVKEEVFFWGSSLIYGEPQLLAANQDTVNKYLNTRKLAEKTILMLSEKSAIKNVAEALNIDGFIGELQHLLPHDLHDVGFNNWRSIVDALQKADGKNRQTISISIKIPIIMTSILAWLCIFGLLLPLGYLSAYEVNSKIILLTTFCLGVIALPFYLGIELIRMYMMKNVKIQSGT